MRKIMLLFFMLIMIMPVAYAENMQLVYDGDTHEYKGPEVNLILNGEKFAVSEGLMPPVIIEDRTLVPVREVFEKLGGNVVWNDKDKSVNIKLEGKEILLTINKTTALIDGKEVSLDVPAKIINNKTMVPVRFISEKGRT